MLRVVEDDSNSILMVTLKSVGRKFFKERVGAIRVEPVLTTKNKIVFEIWEVLERVCENPGGTMAPPLPMPMVTLDDEETEQGLS